MTNNSTQLEEKLKNKIKEIFQFENEDLDFGIYRIMNYKRKEIESFIDKELIKEIKIQLVLLNEEERIEIQKKLKYISTKDGVRKYLKAIEEGDDDRARVYREDNREDIEEYERLKKESEEILISEDLEKEIYNHLINFFSRYYNNGDFISKKRYGKNEKYIVPYNGEEISLYWANKDQYYIKTTDYFRKYTFKAKELTVNFRVIEAEEEKNNVKTQEKKFFVLNEKVFGLDEYTKVMNIYFEYRALTYDEEEKYKHGNTVSQEKANEEIIKILKEKIQSNSVAEQIFENEGEKTFIEKHLYRYTRRNTTDYFIHKYLKGFLERELDFYIKNEFLQLDDLQVLEQSGYLDKLRLYLTGVRVFRNIALKIIEFLAQIENFQKKIWEKKKFVIDTHYVITLDKIKEYGSEEFLESILDEILSNEKQLAEWKELFEINVEKKEDLIKNNGQLELDKKEYKKLPIDTKYFDEDFKWKLLVALSENKNLDDILDGILIKSENWQALNTILPKFKGEVQTIYIDPPFNSKSTEILYRNFYKHSSWLSLMENRILLAKEFLERKGVFICAIDENEQEKLGLLIKCIFNENEYSQTLITILHNPSGIQGGNFSVTNEYAYFVYPNMGRIIYPEQRTHEKADVRQFMNTAKGKTKNYLRESGPNCFYPILVKDFEIIDFGDVVPLDVHPKKSNFLRQDGIIEIYPIDDNGVERKWVFARDTVESVLDELTVKFNEKKKKYEIIRTKKLINYKTVWFDSKYSAKTYGTNLLNTLGIYKFSFPKSLYNVLECIKATTLTDFNSTVLDFFAGSGTTAHAVMKFNKEDGGKRKFILVEMADYFDTVIIPRIKKVAYSFNWKEGRPQDTDGSGVFFKYQILEQYEDALENIEFEEIGETLFELPDYFIKYMLEWETKKSKTFINIDELKDPFNYKLKIIDDYQLKIVNVDIIETFNYLFGLNVNSYKILQNNDRKYVFVFGKKKEKIIVIVWRNVENIDFEKDKEVIENQIKDLMPDEIYINRDAIVKGFKPIEPEFKFLMFEGDIKWQ